MALTKVSGPLLHGGNHNLGNYVINNITGAAATFTSLDCSNIDLSADDLKIVGIITNSVLTPGTVVWVGTGNTLTESDNLTWDNTNVRLKNLGITSTKNLNVTGISTFGAVIDANNNIDTYAVRRKGHTNTRLALPANNEISLQNDSGSILRIKADKVGINSTIPAANLDINGTLLVKGGSAAKPTFRHSAGWGALRVAGSAGGSGAGFIFANNYSGTIEEKWSIYLDGSTDDLRFTAGPPETTASEKVRIQSGGKVGIGTNNPAASLEIHSINSGSNAPLLVKHQRTVEYFRVNHDGRVGINSSSPKSKLDVKGNAIIGHRQDTGNPGTTVGIATILGHHVNSNSDFAQLYLSNSPSSGGGTPSTASIRAGRDTDNYGTNLSFWTNLTGGSAGNGAERLRIKSDGIVLVGTTTAAHWDNRRFTIAHTGDNFLELRGGTSNGCGIIFSDGTGNSVAGYPGYIFYSHASNVMGFHTNDGNERVKIDSSGLRVINSGTVGIHTSTLNDNRLVGPASGISSFRGAYLADGMVVFNDTLNNSQGYYIGPGLNALNAGPVTLLQEMTIDGTWVIV